MCLRVYLRVCLRVWCLVPAAVKDISTLSIIMASVADANQMSSAGYAINSLAAPSTIPGVACTGTERLCCGGTSGYDLPLLLAGGVRRNAMDCTGINACTRAAIPAGRHPAFQPWACTLLQPLSCARRVDKGRQVLIMLPTRS